MTVMGAVTGKEGTITIGGTAVAISDFTVKFERGVVSYSRVGKYGEFNVSGKLKVTGELKRMMIDGAMLARVVGATADASGNWDHNDIGPSTSFNLAGTLANADASQNKIWLANCFLTVGDFNFSDADTIVEETLPFIVRDPDVDVSGNYTMP